MWFIFLRDLRAAACYTSTADLPWVPPQTMPPLTAKPGQTPASGLAMDRSIPDREAKVRLIDFGSGISPMDEDVKVYCQDTPPTANRAPVMFRVVFDPVSEFEKHEAYELVCAVRSLTLQNKLTHLRLTTDPSLDFAPSPNVHPSEL